VSFRHPTIIGATALLASACVEAGGPLTIVQNQAPEIDQTARACKISADRTVDRSALGVFDVALDHSYSFFMYPLVSNALPVLGMAIEPNKVEIHSWQVKIEPPPTIGVEWNPACPAQFDYPNPVTLGPGESASAIVEAMRPCHSDLLRMLMQQGKLSSSLAERILFRVIIRAKGRHGATEILSDPFEYPVRVCYGCLQTGFLDPDFVDFGFPRVPACNKLVRNPYLGNPCNPAQDRGPILCCALDAEAKQIECPGVPRGVAPAMP
jgi:hypothetical protein